MSNDISFPYFLNYYDKEVTGMISDKYGYDHMTALHKFLFSKTYTMLSDKALEMWEFGCPAIFDMWETEQVTGDPRNSVYLRGD